MKSKMVALVGMALLALSVEPAHAMINSLGTTNLLEGPVAGSDSVVLAVATPTAAWTATANDSWLHLSAANQSGTGSTNVVFSFDANPGATRTGTLTIADLTLTTTQAGSTYVKAGALTTLVSSNLNLPSGVAVDGAGNVYIADTYNNAIKVWTAANNTVTTLVSSNLSQPQSVAVDGAGNVYIADYGNNAIKVWTAANSNVITLASSGLNEPTGAAVDGAGNVYIAEAWNSVIIEWSAANSNLTTLVSSGLNNSGNEGAWGLAVDNAGNVYIADTSENAIKVWTAASKTVTTLVSTDLLGPPGVAVDGAGNVYIADAQHQAIKKWTVANKTVTTLVSSGLSYPNGVAVDGAGNIYIVNEFGARPNIMEMPFAFVDPTSKLEGLAAGTDALPVVLPATANLLAPFAPTSDSSWLTISGVTNGVVSFAFTAATTTRTAQITLLGQTIAVTQIIPTLGTTNLLEGPTAGSDSVVLAVATPTAPWTATANAPWLYLSAANQSGTGSTNVVFSFDANPGATRSGTLTVGDQALTVTQAGSTYIAAGAATTLVSSGLNQPLSVAVDSTGNVYIADTVNRAVKKWTAANNTVTTLVSSNLISPYGVAVDGAGNVYFTSGSSLLQVWTATNNTVATLLSSGLNGPEGVAVDGVGNVYFADSFNKAIKEWTAANSNVTTLVSSGLNKPSGVTLDSAGNVYFADTAIKKWTAANSNLTALVSSGLLLTYGVAVDGSGNVYIGDNHYNSSTNAIKKWTAANNTVTTLVTTVVPSGAAYASGVAVDGVGNVYFADVRNNAVKELPYAFVDPTTKLESLAAGNDALPVVLPATANLLPPFAPASDQSWLTIIGITNGVVNFAFTAAGSHRTANITLLGQAIPVTQGSPYFLGTDALWEGPTAGTDGVLLTVIPGAGAWTATTNAGASWLHVSPANQSGTGSTYVVFSYDANPGATRSGTLIIGDQTLTVTQAGSTYVAAGQLTSLASGLSLPDAVTVDGAGNVYFVSAQDGSLKKWTVTSSTLTTLSSSFNWPNGIALDHAGNVYISAGQGAAIYEWSAANHNLTTLYSGEVGSWYPTGVALDGAGNVYFNNFDGGSLFKWTATDGIVTTLASSWGSSYGMAVDGMGNVYSASGGATITKWNATNGTVTHPISGLSSSWGVAVDIAGDLYIADAGDNTIKKWTAANQTLTTLVSSGLSFPADVAVDATGNVYIADGDNGAIKELPRAFVDPTPKLESLAAGNDALPVVLPPTANLTGPFAPASDSSWLAIGGINNGVVSFAFTATTTNRTAHITLLGQIIAITQTATVTPLVLTGGTILANGAFRFSFTNNQGASFTVLTTTNLASPMSNWTVVGTPTNSGSGLFQFTAPMSTNAPQLYYRVSSP